LEYENEQNPFELRRRWVTRCIRLASFHREVDEDIKRRGETLERQGLKAIDALHVACAEAAGSDYFLTCDDQLLRRYRDNRLEVLNPVDFVVRVGVGGDGWS
jgi:predicted nucleic acid-binding protein